MTSTSFISEVLPGADHERHPGTPLAVLELEMGKIPQGFPFVQWTEQFARDEEQATNRIVLLKQSGAMSTRRAVELQEDVEDIDEELQEIEGDLQKAVELTAQGNDQGAPAKPDAPVATSNLEDGE